MSYTLYTQEEKDLLVAAIKSLKGQTVSVAKIAKAAGLNPNRSRFILDEMLEAGTITRTAVKSFNKNYIRYTWEAGK